MKKILVIDESRAVRETLALILSRDFVVVQRPYVERESFTGSYEEMDLLIVGVSAALGEKPSVLLSMASQTSFPVLFLVDSRAIADVQYSHERIDYLAKPFNPYELKEKVVQLLRRVDRVAEARAVPSPAWNRSEPYIEFPYVPASTSALAKRFALTRLPVLLVAEMGSGQERLARAMHSLNHRAGPWVSIFPFGSAGENVLTQLSQKIDGNRESAPTATFFLNGLESLNSFAQSSLLSFLEEQEEKERLFRIVSSSSVDLLERVYRGEFLPSLYYRLAILTLRIAPLRERREDIPSLAVCLAQKYGGDLGIEKISFSAAATERLCNYLWFGNLNEMETVIARTLATHRKQVIEAVDLILGVGEGEMPLPDLTGTGSASAPTESKDSSLPRTAATKDRMPVVSKSGNGNFVHGGVLINELAHELKNPMVTIKTFAQLLGDRFDDAAFRNRFRETVAGDIERMDGLLEALLDFSRFTEPNKERVFLPEQLQQVVEEIVSECAKKEITIRWGTKVGGAEIFIDKDQLHYIAKNVLRAVLDQVQPRGEIQIDIEGQRNVALAYMREGGRISPLTHYLGLSSTMEEALPLRILLAKILLEKNGGGVNVSYIEGGKVVIGIEFPVC